MKAAGASVVILGGLDRPSTTSLPIRPDVHRVIIIGRVRRTPPTSSE